MTLTYQLTDFASRLKVASFRNLKYGDVRITAINLTVCEFLYRYGVVKSFHVKRDVIRVFFKFYRHKPFIRDIEIISRPGHRVYWGTSELGRLYSEKSLCGFYVISTNRGLLSSQECSIYNLGGEVLLKILL